MSGGGSVLDLSLWQLALLLVGVVIAISVRQGLGIGRDLVVGSLRAVVQLYLVGLILAVVFQAARWYWILFMLAVMTAVAAQAATSRLAKPMPHARRIAALALTVSTAVTLAYVIGVIVRVRPWYEPQYMRSQSAPILPGSWPTRSSPRPRATACEEGISTIVRATYGDVSASPMPTMPSSVCTRTTKASWVPSARLVSTWSRRRMIGSIAVICIAWGR